MSNNSPLRVRRAVIPAAGRGTRMQSVSADQAKVLLPVAGQPLVVHALRDLAAAGVTEALVITSPDKPEIERRLGRSIEGIALTYGVQARPDGLADALSLAESFVAGEPFFCWLPDNVWIGSPSASAQLAAGLARVPASHGVGLHELSAADLPRFGSAGFVQTSAVPSARDLVRIDRVLAKGSPPPVRDGRVLKGFPVDLYRADLFDRIRRLRAAHAGREFDDTPLLDELAREGRLHGVVLRDGELFDCGIPDGYHAAVRRLGA